MSELAFAASRAHGVVAKVLRATRPAGGPPAGAGGPAPWRVPGTRGGAVGGAGSRAVVAGKKVVAGAGTGLAGALAWTPTSAPVPVGTGHGGMGGAGGGSAASSPAVTADRQLIAQLLQHFTATTEVRQYMKHYSAAGSQRFAIVKISGDVLHNPLETARVASSLAFLHRIGLLPIVVHGAGLFTGRRSAAVTDAAVATDETPETRRARLMSAATAYMRDANVALVRALAEEGVAAESLSHDVFTAERDVEATGELAGITGVIQRVNVDAISAAIEAGRIPVVASLSTVGAGSGEAGAPDGLLTFSTQDATMALAKRVQPMKVIWLRPEGGLRTVDGKLVDWIDLARDAPHLYPANPASPSHGSVPSSTSPVALRPEDAASLAELAQLYEAMDEPGSSVSITDPEHLAGELFTRRGGGTSVLRGERIFMHANLDAVDVPRLTALIQDSFRATLPPDFWDKLLAPSPTSTTGRRLRRLFVSEDYRGVAIVTEEPGLPGVAYLDKFAVASSAQGDKLGEQLWKAMVSQEPQLYWRSRSSNKVNPWYYAQATGCFKAPAGDWTVFWRGVELAGVMPAITCALALPPTFPLRVYPAGGKATALGSGGDSSVPGGEGVGTIGGVDGDGAARQPQLK